MNPLKVIVATAPKKFIGNVGIIQRNAIQSWINVFGSENIYLFGDDETAVNARLLGVNYARPEYSNTKVPLFDSIAESCQKVDCDYISYVNSDIVFVENFDNIIFKLNQFLGKKIFITGRRINTNLNEEIDFAGDWQKKIRLLASEGIIAPPEWIDYFIFHKNIIQNLPPLRIGRAGFDNYIIYLMKKRYVPIIDTTGTILALHQTHSYFHHPQGQKGVWYGEDAKENLRISGGYHTYLSLDDADYIYRDNILKKNRPKLSYIFSRKYMKGILTIKYPFLLHVLTVYKKIKFIINQNEKIDEKNLAQNI